MIIPCKPLKEPLPHVEVDRRGPRLRRRWPAAERPRMTIAIGMLCTHGLVIAADTLMGMADGSTHTAKKVFWKGSTGGVFAIAYACNDVDAARTLREDLFEELIASDPATLREVEEVVRPVLAKWAASYTHDLPYIDLILGVSLRAPWSPEKMECGGAGLFHCRPPNIMIMKHFLETEPSNYVAIGTGAAITDPICRQLFGSMTNPKETLKQIGYLLYRAKKDLGRDCGGYSTAVFLREPEPAAFEIVPTYLDHAERAGMMMDRGLQLATTALQSSSVEESEGFLGLLRDYIGIMRNYRNLRFLTQFGQEITEHGVTQSDSQTLADQQ
jgi:hypothetical protein